MEQKKKTKAQLERMIKNAIVFVPKDRETESVFFDDKGVRLTVTSDSCVIATGYHQHVFSNITGAGLSRPYLYTKRVIELANKNDCEVRDDKGNVTGRSYAKLLDTLKQKEDKSEYNIAYFYGWWLLVIFDGLYSISEDEVSSWLVYFKYITIIATNAILLEEHKEDVTNKQFVSRFKSLIDEFTENIEENILLKALSDEERVKQELSAIQENEMEEQFKQ